MLPSNVVSFCITLRAINVANAKLARIFLRAVVLGVLLVDHAKHREHEVSEEEP